MKHILIILSLLFFSSNLLADHTTGGDLTWRALGNNQYEFTLKVYRDCDGATTPGGTDFNCLTGSYVNVASNLPTNLVFQSSCGGCQNVVLPNPVITEVTPICPTFVTRCQNSSSQYQGIQEFKYTTTITLAPCDTWEISYTNYARNASITNINAPAANGMTIVAKMWSQTAPNNSSPQFQTQPVPFTCVGQEFCFSHFAIDPDGDSIVYSWTRPLNHSAAPLVFRPGLSFNNPVISSPAASLNSQTGDICMKPTAVQTNVFAIKIEEFRNGVKIGEVMRDMQLSVLGCENAAPAIEPEDLEFCVSDPAKQTCFTLPIQDADGDKIAISAIASIPGVTIVITGNNTPSGTVQICWTPTATSKIETVRITATDDHCPFKANQIVTIKLVPVECKINVLDVIDTICDYESFTITLLDSMPAKLLADKWDWSDGFSGKTRTIVGAGQWTVTCTNTTFNATDIVTVKIAEYNAPIITVPPIQVCFDSIFTVNVSQTFGTFSVTGPGLINTFSNRFTARAIGTSNQSYVISRKFKNCVWDTTIVIQVFPERILDLILPKKCISQFGSAISIADPYKNLNWVPCINMNDCKGDLPEFQFNSDNIYTVTGRDLNNCKVQDTVKMVVSIAQVPTIIGKRSICIGESISLQEQNNLIVQWPDGSTDNKFDFSPTSNTTVVAKFSDPSGCITQDTHKIVVNPLPSIVFIDRQTCEGGNVSLNFPPTNTYLYSDGSRANPYILNKVGIYNLTVTVTSAQQCKQNFSAKVSIFANPKPQIQSDSLRCTNDTITLNVGSAFKSYKWSTNATTRSIKPNVGVKTTYIVTVTDSNNCQGNVSKAVNVIPLATSNIQDDVICIDDTFKSNIIWKDAVKWSWSGPNLLDAITLPQNRAVPPSKSTYTILATNSKHGIDCTKEFKQIVDVIPIPIARIQGDSIGCTNSNFSLTSIGNFKHNWYQNGVLVSTSNPYTGVYTNSVKIKLVVKAGTCSDSTITGLTARPIPTANIIAPNQVCLNDTFSLRGIPTSPNAVFKWKLNNAPLLKQQITDSTITFIEYEYTIVDVLENCVFNGIHPVIINPLPYSSPSLNQVCKFDNATIRILGNFTTISIPNPIQEILTLSKTYTYTIETAAGCSALNSFRVQVDSLPKFPLKDDSICFGDTFFVVNLPTPPLSSSLQASYAPIQDSVIVYTINNQNTKCTNLDSFSIKVNPIPLTTVTALPNPHCIDSLIQLQLNGTENIRWIDPLNINLPINVARTYRYEVSNVSGCTRIDTLQVDVFPKYIFNLPILPVCDGETILLQPTNGTIRSISPEGFPDRIENPRNIQYSIIWVDSFGCGNRHTINPVVNPLPQIQIDSNFTVACNTYDLALFGANQNQYVFTQNGVTSNDTFRLTNAQVQSILVEVTNSFGCTKDSIILTGRLPMTQPLVDLAGCRGDVVNFGISASARTWTDGINNNFKEYLVLDSRTVAMSGIDTLGCPWSQDLNVERYPDPEFNIVRESLVGTRDFNPTIRVNVVQNVFEWVWQPTQYLVNPKDLSPEVIVDSIIQYTLTVKTDKGCIGIDSIRVVELDEFDIQTPTGFFYGSENGIWKPYYPSEQPESVKLIIYDRWGNLVFEVEDDRWDGTIFNGKEPTLAVYAYYLVARFKNGVVRTKAGNITVLK